MGAVDLFARCELVEHLRVFGDVRIEFALPRGITNPIAVNDEEFDGSKYFVTQSEIVYRYGQHALAIPARYPFDGASIPRRLWGLKGYSPLEIHIWAALPHDYICEHPEVLPRGIGDAIFDHILGQLASERKLARRQALEMYWAVRLYTRLKAWMTAEKN